ncbi:hypothetical protein KY337_01450 [Candidatus Woesearchaeota archaeon]|nr:hypothetical protein [Candidatus Woesearchaeota archaeon]
MTFSKQFPKTVEGSNYPKWVEIYLDEHEEGEIESKARDENISLMKECVEDAKEIMKGKGLNDYQSDMVKIAISLFEKRASHSVHFKENKCKEKFDSLHKT